MAFRAKSRGAELLLVAAILLLVGTLVLPWWSETEIEPSLDGFGGGASTQSYSPLTGVSGTCTYSCSGYGVPTFAVGWKGQVWFSTLRLNATGDLYLAALGGVFAGLAAAGVTVAATWSSRLRVTSRRARRLQVAALIAALLSVGAAAAILPLFQAQTLWAGQQQWNEANWNPSPSPQTSFMGACSPGPDNGICASGWAVSWGPTLGWDLLVVSLALLLLSAWRITLRDRQSPGTGDTVQR